jgi:type III restriction enzyme
MKLLPFQIEAATQIVDRFMRYMERPLMRDRVAPVPFYQNLSAITGAGKTVILADVVEQIRTRLPVEPVVLWLSKGKVVVWQTYANLSTGKYASLLGGYKVKPLLDANASDLEDSSMGLLLVATVGKFNQRDMEKGDRRIFQVELDKADKSLWNMLGNRRDDKGRKRHLVVIYDEGHNLSDQQTKLLLDLAPDALIAASATMRIPYKLAQVVLDRLKNERGWTDKEFSTVVKSSAVVKSGLIKKNILLGGYVTPMEVAIDEMLADMENVENSIEELGLSFQPKAIYVCNTNVVSGVTDIIRAPFEQRMARPIAIWRHLVQKGIAPSEIAVYCNLKFDPKFPAPSDFVLFDGGDSDYDQFLAGNYRHVIFNLTLQEGWDDPECYFAYIDKDMGSKDQITQVIGRALRQPGVKHYPVHALNTAHFYIRADEKQFFKELLEDVNNKITANMPDITITFHKGGPGGDKKPLLPPKLKREKKLPNVPIDCTNAKEPISRIIAKIPDFRENEINTVGPGGRIQVLQTIGAGNAAVAEWVDTEHSARVTARWVFRRELQKYNYSKAENLCAIEEPKFDALIEYNSIAAQNIREAAEKVVDAYIEYSTIVQNPADSITIREVPVNYKTMQPYKNAIHEGYSDLNQFEKKFAEALDRTKKVWFRNPSRGLFDIPLLDKGDTNNFNPDFIVWTPDAIFALDPKGDTLITKDSARKLFFIKKIGSGPELLIRLITEGKWDEYIKKVSAAGYTVWKLKHGKICPFHVVTVDEAVQVCLQKD